MLSGNSLRIPATFNLLKNVVRFLRSQRQKDLLPPKSATKESLDNILQPSNFVKYSRHPQHVLNQYKEDKVVIPEINIEVTDLKSDDVQPSKSKKILGKEVAEKIRQSKRRSHQKGHGQPDLGHMSHVEMAKLLRQQLIYADENLVIMNKPYGLAAHDGDEINMSFRSCLPILSKMVYGLNSSVALTLCNRLDKSTTGITVCAANKDMAYKIMQLFRQQQIRRKYWAMTSGAPSPSEGIIDIPLCLRHVAANQIVRKFAKMALAPEKKLDWQSGDMVKVRPRNANVAITHYQVLDRNEGLALVEMQPFTTVKHQIRVHAAEALSCPILGDHKYSKSHNLSPQTIPKKVLSRFEMKRTRTREMPMHLHLREILIPGVLENSEKPNLLVSAKLPLHMYRTSKLFKLKPGMQSDFKYPAQLRTKKSPNMNNHNKIINPHMEELYIDPFKVEYNKKEPNELQRQDCYSVYKPRVQVKTQSEDEMWKH